MPALAFIATGPETKRGSATQRGMWFCLNANQTRSRVQGVFRRTASFESISQQINCTCYDLRYRSMRTGSRPRGQLEHPKAVGQFSSNLAPPLNYTHTHTCEQMMFPGLPYVTTPFSSMSSPSCPLSDSINPANE
jgi:hypothetical protein